VCSLREEIDCRPAEPLAAALDRTGNLFTSIVPPGYERYVRVVNPIGSDDGSVIKWSDIMERNDLEPSPWMQWDELKAHPDGIMPAGNAELAMGDPHPHLVRALIRELRPNKDRHYFATWVGYAEGHAEPTIEFSPSQREMAIYSGALIDPGGTVVVPTTETGRVSTYWWPRNLQWCVGQDLYARGLIIGCDLPTAGRILATPDLDSYLIRGSHMVLSEDF
jgi:hypothetical protein